MKKLSRVPTRTSPKTFRPGKIISGGQTGADLGGLVAARRLGIKTGGVAPAGYRTERGSQAEVLKGFGLTESASSNYGQRTRENILAANGVLIFAEKPDSPGTVMTRALCDEIGRPSCLVRKLTPDMIEFVRFFMNMNTPLVLNIAGNRESVAPGLTRAVADFLVDVFND